MGAPLEFALFISWVKVVRHKNAEYFLRMAVENY